MKKRYLLIIILILCVIAILSSFDKKTAFFQNEDKKNINVTVKNSDTKEETKLDLEEYIIGVVAGEMPASFHEEALKAQAIAARSYALYKINTTSQSYDLVNDITNQVYITKEEMLEKWQENYDYYYEKIKTAVLETKDLVMEYDGQIISAYYFAMSNGSTEDVSLVFGENREYLTSVDSQWDKNVKNFEVTTEINKEAFCNKLAIDCTSITIGDINRSNTGRINNITINNKTFSGTNFRNILGLRSTDFDIEITDKIFITTRGYGHGVGMSQYGANEMAKNGYTYKEILNHYYQNVDIVELNV